MDISLDQIKQLREKTGVSMMACKKALTESGGDIEKATEYLRKKGEAKAAERSERGTSQGIVASYIHGNSKIGVLVKLGCETDFVAKNDDFKALGNDIAMHIAAMNPLVISPDDVDENLLGKEREIWREQLANEGKPENIVDNIMQGKEKKFKEEVSLLKQPFVKDPEKTIEQLLVESINKIGENIQIVDFARYSF
jgi:elongation factor Ts